MPLGTAGAQDWRADPIPAAANPPPDSCRNLRRVYDELVVLDIVFLLK